VIPHDEAGFRFIDRPGRREAAGRGKLFGNVHPPEAESPCNGVARTLFAFQHFVEPTTINMMPLRKSGLTPFTFNGGSQHAMQVVLVEYDCAATTP
jgi:hypothetical protein